MASSNGDLFQVANLQPAGSIPWGQPVPEVRPGVYTIGFCSGRHERAPVDVQKLESWMAIAKDMTLNGEPVTHTAQLAELLNHFWLPDETVLYIGLASKSLRSRTRQFCNHVVGHTKPHRGGYWLKLLSEDALADLVVHWATTPMSDQAEFKMLSAFEQPRPRANSTDPLLPFANLEIKVPRECASPWGGVRRRTKAHGLRAHTVDPYA